CAAFIQLFHRLPQPGGMLVFTTHGRACANELATGKNRNGLADEEIAALLDGYNRNGFSYIDYSAQPGYGFSLALPSYVLARFVENPAWDLIGYHEAGWDKRQDVISLRRQA
ncbi:MAG: class I SAM-dependent methyltransferase, partial [Opitutales bacterium]